MKDVFIEDNVFSIAQIKIAEKYPIKKVEIINNKYIVLLKIPRVELGDGLEVHNDI